MLIDILKFAFAIFILFIIGFMLALICFLNYIKTTIELEDKKDEKGR